MTVIIALKHNGQNYIAADCRTSAGHSLVNDHKDKILKHNNCFIGLAGGVAEEGMVRKILNANKDLNIEDDQDILDLYLKLRTLAKDHNLLDVGDDPCIEGLFVTDKNIWELYPNGAIVEHKTQGCIGCGADYAVGLLGNTNITNPEKDLKTIIKKVSKYSTGVSPNSIVKVPLSTKIIKKLKKSTKKSA